MVLFINTYIIVKKLLCCYTIKLTEEINMKKLLLLCLAPAMLLASCNKAQMKVIKGRAEDNDFRTQVGNIQFSISSDVNADCAFISFAIENEGTKDLTFRFRNSYLVVEDRTERFELHFVHEMLLPAPARPAVEYDQVTVAADSSELMTADTPELNRAILDGLTVTFHTEINGKYSFTISNMCADLR